MIGRLRQVFQREGLRNVLILLGGTGGGQVVLLLASPLLTRLYVPEEFGVLVAYTGLLAPLLVIASLRYEFAIPLPGSREEAAALLRLALVVLFGMTGIVLMALLVVWGWELLPSSRPLVRYGWALPAGLLGGGIYQALSYWAVREQQFPKLAQTKLVQGVGTALSQVLLGILTLGPVGLLLGDIVGRSAGSGTLANLIRKEGGASTEARVSLRYVASKYRRFPVYVGTASVINALGTQSIPLLLILFYGAQVGGWIGLSIRVIGAPVALIGGAVAQVYLDAASRLAREDPRELESLYKQASTRLILLAAGPALVLGTLSPYVFPWLFGADWQQAGVYTSVLCIPFLLQFSVAPLNQMLNVVGRQDLQLYWNAARLAAIALSVYAASVVGASPFVAVVGLSIANTISYALNWMMTIHGVRNPGELHG